MREEKKPDGVGIRSPIEDMGVCTIDMKVILSIMVVVVCSIVFGQQDDGKKGTDESRISDLISALANDDLGVREDAAEQLVNIGTRATKLLEAALMNGNAEVRARVESILYKIDPSRPIIPLLKDQDPLVRSAAIRSLVKLGAKGAGVKCLTNLLKDESQHVRRLAVWAIGMLKAKEVAPELIDLLCNSSSAVRASAICALRELGYKESTAELKKLLVDQDESVQFEAVRALYKFEERSACKGAIDALKEKMKDSDKKISCLAASRLILIGEETTVPENQKKKLLESCVQNIRWLCIWLEVYRKEKSAPNFTLPNGHSGSDLWEFLRITFGRDMSAELLTCPLSGEEYRGPRGNEGHIDWNSIAQFEPIAQCEYCGNVAWKSYSLLPRCSRESKHYKDAFDATEK